MKPSEISVDNSNLWKIEKTYKSMIEKLNGMRAGNQLQVILGVVVVVLTHFRTPEEMRQAWKQLKSEIESKFEWIDSKISDRNSNQGGGNA